MSKHPCYEPKLRFDNQLTYELLRNAQDERSWFDGKGLAITNLDLIEAFPHQIPALFLSDSWMLPPGR